MAAVTGYRPNLRLLTVDRMAARAPLTPPRAASVRAKITSSHRREVGMRKLIAGMQTCVDGKVEGSACYAGWVAGRGDNYGLR